MSRPPVDSSPRPSLTCSPSPMVRATSARARALTTAARSLASRPSERSGWVAVERLGDDHAEHRVAEELQPLVGRQPAVLVGERPVRQRTLEELGVQDRIAERCPQVGVRRRVTARSVRGPDDGRRGRRTGRTRRTRGAAGAWHRRPGWRRSPGRARRPSTANDGDACCCATSSASEQPLISLLSSAGLVRPVVRLVVFGPAPSAAPPTAGRSRPRAGGPDRPRAAHHTRCTDPDSRPGTAAGTAVQSTTASRSSGSRSSRSPSSRLVRSSVLVGGGVARRRRRRAPGSRPTMSSRISSRHRTHSPTSPAVAVPVTSTPSMTASSRRSNSTGDPSGTRRTSMPRSAGAGAVSDLSRCDPGRRPSSRVSSTSGALGSRRTAGPFTSSGRTDHRSTLRRPGLPTVGMEDRRQEYRTGRLAAKTDASAVEVLGQPDLVDLVVGERVEHRCGRPGAHDPASRPPWCARG